MAPPKRSQFLEYVLGFGRYWPPPDEPPLDEPLPDDEPAPDGEPPLEDPGCAAGLPEPLLPGLACEFDPLP